MAEECILWTHHRLELFVGSIILFWVVAVINHRRSLGASDSNTALY
jgi:hypothetical protein